MQRINTLALFGLAASAIFVAGMWKGAHDSAATASIVPAVPLPEGREKQPVFYGLRKRQLTPWGDYGDILQNGMTAHRSREGGLLRLERTGPYMPPITFPGSGDIVVSDEGRKLLEASGLSGFRFQPVIKAKIVRLAWHKWDRTRPEPLEYPASGEPEDYILQRDADSKAAEQLGNVWEVVIPVTAKIGRRRAIVDSLRELYVERASWNGSDLFRGHGYGGVLATQDAKAWFEDRLKGFVAFEAFGAK